MSEIPITIPNDELDVIDFSQEKNIPHILRVKHNRENPYLMVNKKAIWDNDLSLDTLGLWTRLMSRPDNWHIHVSELMKSCNMGRDRIKRMMGELLTHGYAHKVLQRADGKRKNQFAGYIWYIFEFKMSTEEIKKMFPATGFPSTEDPATEDPHLLNTDILPIPKDSIEKKKEGKAREARNPSPASSASPKKKEKPEKDLYLEFVLLSKEEHEKLLKLYDGQENLLAAMQMLNAAIGSKDHKYKSHYFVLGRGGWAYRQFHEDKLKKRIGGSPGSQNSQGPSEMSKESIQRNRYLSESLDHYLRGKTGPSSAFDAQSDSAVLFRGTQKPDPIRYDSLEPDQFEEKLTKILLSAFPLCAPEIQKAKHQTKGRYERM